VTWGAYKYTSDTILVPFELLEDTPFNLPQILGEMMGERIGRITNRRFTTGTGSGQPQGLITAAATGVTAAATNAITEQNLVQLVHSVDPAYRGGAGFMMHDNTVLAVRLLRDSNGQPVWQSVYNSGVPDMLLGYPITVNQHMAHVSSGAASKVMAFGQLSKYKIRRVNQIRMYRLEERYREKDQDGFVAFVREDGGLLDAGTDPVKLLVLAAS
jgi:HK97 family phage major capsid protein